MSRGTSTSAPAYRGDIQGMRALAVIVVISAHAVVPGMPGGFVGVDVFFVVSGFLITQLIVTGIQRDDRFSLGRFYARRARRIVPAASLVLAVDRRGLDRLLQLHRRPRRHPRTPLWAAFFAANIRFGTQGIDYFSLEDSASPLQHYWSLAVEEQFYVVWPLLDRRRRLVDPSSPDVGPAPLGALLMVRRRRRRASFAWSVHRTAIEPTARPTSPP